MNYLSLLLVVVSLAVLIIGAFLWRCTGQRKLLVNVLFASFGLLYAAYEAAARNRPEWAIVLPFFATMLFAGRAAGSWWRGRKDQQYREPARLLSAASGLTFLATVAAYLSIY